MPLKWWSFEVDGHPVRAEIWWGFTGWYRKRLYVDHRRVIGVRGRFRVSRPLVADLRNKPPEFVLEAHFKPRRFWTDMGCEFVINSRILSSDMLAQRAEKRWFHSLEKEGIPNDGPSLGCFIVFPLLIVLWILSIPFGVLAAVGAGIDTRRRRREEQRLLRRGRFLEWTEVERRSRESASTLIVRAGHMSPREFWWVPEDVPAVSPVPPPSPFDVVLPGAHLQPFNEWCWSRYISVPNGAAFRTTPGDSIDERLDPFEDPEALSLRKEFPHLRIVFTGYSVAKPQIAHRFAGLFSRTVAVSLPALIAALEDEASRLRRLAIETLRLAGTTAAEAVPALTDHFYRGPEKDRLWTVRALCALGPAGVETVRAASQLRDPIYRMPADAALRSHEYRDAHPRPLRPTIVHAPQPSPAEQKRRRIRSRLTMLIWIALPVAAFLLVWWRHDGYLATAAALLVLPLIVAVQIVFHVTAIVWRVRRHQQPPPQV